MRIIWLKEEILFLKENYMIMKDEELAEKLGKTTIQIKDKRNHEHLVRVINFSKEFLISEFWRFFNENKRYPLKKELKPAIGYPSGVNYERKWGSWNNFLKEINVLGNSGWYKYDEQVLIDYYTNSSIEDINNKLMIKRNKEMIMKKANNLGLYIKKRSSEEYQLIIQDYLNGINCQEIAKKYGYSDGASIYYILKKYNIELNRNDIWSEEQIQILKTCYPATEWDELLELLKPFDKDGITHKASDLNIKRLLNSEWSEEDIDILKEYYGEKSTKQLAILLPYRTESSIVTKGYKLGLESRIRWSDEDIEIFIKEYPIKTNKELANIFNRTPNAVMAQGVKLGLKKDLDEHLYITYDKEKLIRDLKDFALFLGRTPLAQEISENKEMAHHNTYGRCFNGYVNACQVAGLEPNYSGNIFSNNTYRSKNNDLCLSHPELIITNLFIDNSLGYEKEVYYSAFTDDIRCGYKRCDWFLANDIIVEYFGLQRKEFYQKRTEEKQKICKDNNLTLLELYPEDMKHGLKGLINKFKEHGIKLNVNN